MRVPRILEIGEWVSIAILALIVGKLLYSLIQRYKK